MSQPVAAQKAEKRVPGIDLLRGLCIVAVVLHHINLRIHFRDSSLGQLIGPAANRVLFWNGYYGVRMFFVISGFLITTWSLKRWGSLSQLDRRQFYLMRFARIVPCLVALLVLLSILDRFGVPRFTINTQHTSLGRALLAALTFHVNWLEAHTGYLPAAWDVLWSLSVEEIFYVFFPLLCTMLRKPALLIGVFSCFVIAGPFARVQTNNELWADYGYLSCMDGIALGCLAALLAAKVRLNHKSNLVLRFSGILLILLITVFRGTAARLALYKVGLDVTTLQVGAALLVIALQQSFEARAAFGHSPLLSSSVRTRSAVMLRGLGSALFRSTEFLRWFGRNSYEVYLTHMLVVWPMVGLFFHFHQGLNTAVLWFLAITALTGVAGHVLARSYSGPLNRRLRTRSLHAAPRSAVAAGD
ncbi:MAG TPA: acyltransferase [Candidatus Angelobacter sp.]|nr:acyltransferase [Candidatus Angelobacter sp.]